MAISFKDFIYNCYHSRFGASTSFNIRSWETIDLSESRPFIKYMKIPINTDTIEVPCIYKYMIMNAIAENKKNPENAVDNLYIPIMCLEKDNVESRTSNGLLRRFLYDTSSTRSLTRKKGNGTVYLGGEGLLLYEDYTPILMLTMEIKKNPAGKYVPIRPIARINPIIYSRNDILAKFIRTKFITGLIDMRLSREELEYFNFNINYWRQSNRANLINHSGLLTTKIIDYDFKIILDDFSEFFFTPKAPDVTFDSSIVNNMLLQDFSQGNIKYDI